MKCLTLKCKDVRQTEAINSTSRIRCFSVTRAELGEGPVWHAQRNSLFWVDIISKNIHEKGLDSEVERIWTCPFSPSSLVLDEKDSNVLWVLSETYLCRFNPDSSVLSLDFPLHLQDGYRTNDGGVGYDGRYWFGSMKWKPERKQGSVYSIGRSGDLRLEIDGIAIPNTFCWLNDSQLLISDSFENRCLSYNPTSLAVRDFIDHHNADFTPDGGAVDKNGCVWIALWGAGKVAQFEPSGKLISEIEIPVPQPSSCCFGGSDLSTLFVTSAREGLSDEELSLNNFSGQVFAIDLPTEGRELMKFGKNYDC